MTLPQSAAIAPTQEAHHVTAPRSKFDIAGRPQTNRPALSIVFANGRCIAAHAPVFQSAILTSFFANVIQYYLGKMPSEISIHARKYSDAMLHWPAPSDMRLGWALTKNVVRMTMDQYADEAENARRAS